MASTSSQKSYENEISSLIKFMDKMNINDVINEFLPVQEASVNKEEVSFIEAKFEVKFSKTGKEEVLRLLKHFETNNNPEYITRAFTKWTPNITDLFENLPRC